MITDTTLRRNENKYQPEKESYKIPSIKEERYVIPADGIYQVKKIKFSTCFINNKKKEWQSRKMYKNCSRVFSDFPAASWDLGVLFSRRESRWF